MRPQLFRIPGIDLPVFSYGFMIMIGFICAILYAAWRAKREKIDPNYVFDVGLYAVVFGILGARAMYYWEFYHKPFPVRIHADAIVEDEHSPLKRAMERAQDGTMHEIPGSAVRNIDGKDVALKELSFAQRPWYTFFFIQEGGIVFYGGFLLAAGAIIGYLWREKRRLARRGEPPLPILRMTDVLACAVPLGLSFGRIGCFLNGCCWGQVVKPGHFALLQVKFPFGSPAFQSQVDQGLIPPTAPETLPVHCTELYEWGGALIITAILFLLYRYKRRDGQIFALLAILYGPLRYVIEGLREHDPTAERTQLGLEWLIDPIAGKPMTNSQMVSWAILVVGVICFILTSYFGPKYVPPERREDAEPGKA